MSSISQNKSEKRWFDLQFHDTDQQNIKKPDELSISINKDYPPSIIKNEILDRIGGSIFGMAIGDALGAHVEFRPHSYLEANPVKDLEEGGTWGLKKGQFTDDTSMALCLANSLIACHDFVPYDQLVRYKWWYRYGYMSSTGHCFDIGIATRQSIQEFEARQRKFVEEYDIPFDQMDTISDFDLLENFNAYCSQDRVVGNGALMRLAPVPLFFYQDHEKAVQYAGISGQITHGDEKAYDACRYYGALIVAVLHGANKDDLLSETFYEKHKEWFGNKTLHPDIMNIAQGSYKKKGGYNEGIRGKGYVVNALEAALWAFWSDENSFEKGALNAVNLGDDTDTTAAIYGQLAGAFYGYNKLPDKWRKLVYAKDFILCVSNWIAYEGDRWFKKQKPTETNELLINSDTNNSNKAFQSSTIPKEELYFNNSHRSTSLFSLGHNLMSVIDRKAIDPSGRVGYLYNGCQDCIIKLMGINFKTETIYQPIRCVVESGSKIECQNLLRFIGFDGEFRLSIESNMVSPSGIASVVEYPYLIDECTRILYYSYVARQDFLPDSTNDIKKMIQQLTSKTEATHIITKVDWGIEFILLFRFISNDMTTNDNMLNQICKCLTDNTNISNKILFNDIISMNTYSNIHQLNNQNTIMELHHTMNAIKNKIDDHQPINYTLHPIRSFYSDNNNTNYSIFTSLKPSIKRDVEQHLLRLSSVNKIWKTIIDDKLSEILHIKLKQQLDEANHLRSKLNDQYKDEQKRIKHLIINIRQNNHLKETSEHQLLNEEKKTHDIDDFMYFITSLKEKGHFIQDLEQRGFHYQNANKYDIKQNDNDIIIQQKLIKDNNERFLCSNNTLNNNNWSRLDELYSKMLNERKLNPHIRIIYLDFSYSSYELNQMKIYPLNNDLKNLNERESLLTINNQISDHSSISSIDDNTIYILLIGKSGVGKSTLINNFNNYLQFKNYQDLQSRRSLLRVIIPFARPIPSGVEENLIRFGISNPNENYDPSDQSVTQQCKLHYFNIDNKQKLCFIDAPGFDKIHQKNNDDINIQHILSYIINLTHLNAICVILEHDDIILDSYQLFLTHLFNLIGNNIANNILFCFTKSLSKDNHSTQIDTYIKSMIETLPTQNIQYNQNTTFSFDSTFFIDLTTSNRFKSLFDNQNNKLKESWTISSNGWKRFLNYIRKNLRPCYIQQGLQKSQSIRIEINQIIRPLIETIRNNIRNIILSGYGYNNYYIQLHPIHLLHPSAICYKCIRHPQQYGPFWIMSDAQHEFGNNCHTCSCHQNEHIRIDYRIEYQYLWNQTNNHPLRQSYTLEDLFNIIVKLFFFIIDGNQSNSNDPFLSIFNRIIDEEKFICQNMSFPQCNLELYNYLVNFKENYQRKLNILKEKHIQNTSDIDRIMEYIKQIPTIKIQLDQINKIQQTSA